MDLSLRLVTRSIGLTFHLNHRHEDPGTANKEDEKNVLDHEKESWASRVS